MSDTVLSGRWTVYYEAENRQKRIVWTGGAASPDTVKSLYLALMDLFDEFLQMDDGVPMKADTPTEYLLGIIDPGDDDPWFMDKVSSEHLIGGAIKTVSWKRVTDSNTGIIKVICSNTDIVAGDIGEDISGATTGNGTLLDVKGTGAGSELWIRPDSDAVGDDFTTDTQTITCNVHEATQTGALSYTGEMMWANIYALGTLMADTHLYIYQGVQAGDTAPDAILTGYKTDLDWWGDVPPLSDFDILILVADQAADLVTRSEFNDQGYISVLARQYSKTCTFYIVDLFAGGRNPIPLEIGTDLNNETGWRTNTLSGAAGTFNVGDEILQTTGTNTGARGKITAILNPGATPTLRYYLIGDVSLDFENGETIENQDDTGTGTGGTSADYGPALLSGLSIAHLEDETFDIDENGTPEYYSIVLDVSDEFLADAYEWAKYETRRGEVGTTNHHDIEGEQYIGSDYRITYTSLSGTISSGDVVIQQVTLATGTVVAHHTTPKILILRNCRGTFNNTNQIDVGGNNVTGPTSVAISPIKACPYGTFAGGVWFGAPGVVFDNVKAAELNNYQLTDDQGNVVAAPTKVTVKVENTRIKDRLAIFRLTGEGEQIDKTEYEIDAGHSIGDTAVSVDPVIAADVPGKATGGILFIVDLSALVEHRYRYVSWSGDDFTLFQKAADVAEGDTDTETIVAVNGFLDCLAGDIIYNSTRTTITYIVNMPDDSTANVFPAVAGQTTGDNFRVGALAEDYVQTDDKVYVPFIHVEETVGTDAAKGDESVSVTFGTTIYVRVRARHANDVDYNIKPFEIDGEIGSGGLTVPVIRTDETITS